MEKLDILLWIVSAGFSINCGFMILMLNSLNNRMDKADDRDEKNQDRLTRIENDMIEVKTILRMKECCMIKDDRQSRKAE